MSRVAPFAGAMVVTAVSALATAAAYPTTSRASLAWIGLVPFLLALRRAGTVPAPLLGAWWMLCFAWGINDWFPPAVSLYLSKPAVVGYLFFLGVTLGSAAPGTVLFAACVRRLGAAPRAWAPLATAAAWTAGEFLRGRWLGDPWGLLGYSQAFHPEWIQVASLAGTYGVGFLVVLVNAAIAETLLAGPALPRFGLPVAASLAGGPALALACYAGAAPYRHDAGAPLEVALVQGNVDLESAWSEPMQEANLDRYLRLTDEALARRGADLVVWPENAVTFFLASREDLRGRIAALLARRGTRLLAGAPHQADDTQAVYANSAFLLGGDGSVAGRYDKQVLLPFGEYQPLSALDLVSKRFETVREFSAGAPGQGPLASGDARLGVVICNEAMLAEPSAGRVEAGANLLVALTNDSWVGRRRFAEQAAAMAVLRAVEQRRWLVRASTSGPSMVVDAAGRVREGTPWGVATTLGATARLLDGRSVYSMVGDAFAWACSAVAVALLGAARRVRQGA